MRLSNRNVIFKGLAFGPATFVLALGVATAASGAGDVYRTVVAAEAGVVKALTARDAKALGRTTASLGKLIEDALKRHQSGQGATACDMAAHSLAFVAASASEGLANSGEAKRLLLDDAKAAAADFAKDMQACDKQSGQKMGSHTSVEKALRAL
ncbi:hypothetical protein HFC70_12405 [Agrobacterium sp. a22-2]|uniref:hypothetical protein n=1 Tax=Agrobacterium sp. a22-2 TaxID=2283840 RepID=UPI001444C0F2|nr:hypothetical protein [Agrobacterium sp. a22-2]NKN37158.1 hypothetical protein [Agrobacterium sp. a22-2]